MRISDWSSDVCSSDLLMLANFRRDDRVTALRRLVKRSNGPLRQDFLAALAKIQRSARTPAFDPAPPFGLVRLLVALALPERDHPAHAPPPPPTTRKVTTPLFFTIPTTSRREPQFPPY